MAGGRRKAAGDGWPPSHFPLPSSPPSLFPLPPSLLLCLALPLIAVGIWRDLWWLSDSGLALLALVGFQRPVLWGAALLFALPFYLHPLPILPGRALNLIEIGVWGGLALVALRVGVDSRRHPSPFPLPPSLFTWLAAIIILALLAALAADHRAVALREWRVLFVAAGGFALLLHMALHVDRHANGIRTLIMGWLLGGTVIALNRADPIRQRADAD